MRMVVKPIGKILVRLNLAQGLNDQVVDGVRVTSGVEFLWDGSEEEILLYFVLSWVCRQFLRAVIDIAVGIASRHSFRQFLFSLLDPLNLLQSPKLDILSIRLMTTDVPVQRKKEWRWAVWSGRTEDWARRSYPLQWMMDMVLIYLVFNSVLTLFYSLILYSKDLIKELCL